MTDDLKAILYKPQRIGARAAEYQARIMSIRSRALPKGIAYDGIRVKSTPAADPMGDIEAEVEEWETKYRQLMHAYVDAQNELAYLIAQLRDPDQKIALHMHYVSGATWYDVAKGMSYSESTIYKIRRRGIRELEQVCSKNSLQS